MLRSLVVLGCVAVSLAQYPVVRNSPPAESIPSWYQMAKPAAAPAYAYERRDYDRLERQPPTIERQPQHTNSFSGYPSYGSNRPSYPEQIAQLSALGGPTVSQGQQVVRRYPGGGANQDVSPYASSISRYHKLLLNKNKIATTEPEPVTVEAELTSTRPVPMTTRLPKTTTRARPSSRVTGPKKPKSLRKIYSTIMPRATTTSVELPTPAPEVVTSPRARTFRPNIRGGMSRKRVMNALKWKKLTPKTTVSTTVSTTTSPTPTLTTTPRTTTTTTAAPTSTSRSSSTSTTTESTKTTTTTPLPRPAERTFRPRVGIFRRLETTPKPSTTTTAPATPQSLVEYLWPNSELLNAIKDVVAKFKASLDETGIDQDVRLMGNQLRSTWQQLRTGVDRGVKAVKYSAEHSLRDMNYGSGPMNEQLGRLFEKAADATEERLRRD